MSTAGALLRAMRPHQWTKNLFVFAPLLFAGQVHMFGKLGRVGASFAIFCMISSAVYLLNDVADREADRQHPEKRNRPIASGELGVGAAVAAAAFLVIAGLGWAWFGLHSNKPLAIFVTYLLIQAAYNAKLKHLVILDVLCIASGFVLRLLVGASTAWVQSSRWIVVCTIFLSLFLALCKRRGEVVSMGEGATETRSILSEYPLPLLDQLIGVATSATLVTYALFAVEGGLLGRVAAQNGGPLAVSPMALTIPIVIYGIFRYLFLVYRRNAGGSPTKTLLRDPASLACGVLFAASIVLIRHFLVG